MRFSFGATLALLLTACGGLPPAPGPLVPWAPIAPAPDDSVDAVLFLVGDGGEAVPGGSPVMTHLRRDVEYWAERIGRDSVVAVVFLGDNIYPRGLHPPDHPDRAVDSMKLAAQVEVMEGPQARRYGAFGYFVAGNHDWGLAEGVDGVDRLKNMHDFLRRAREGGAPVGLFPGPGEPGPTVVDIGERTRLVLFDSAWWLLGPDPGHRTVLLSGIAAALDMAGERRVILAAHHPWASAGSHSGLVPFWETLGLRVLLSRSGALLQDLSSGPYRELLDGLRRAFAVTRPPFVYAGGHDHSLQVLAARDSLEPRFMLVSGSASKVTSVGAAPGMNFAASQPGYMRLMVRKDGAADLFITATAEDLAVCGAGTARAERCMEKAMERFGTIFSVRLVPASAEALAPRR